MIERVEIDSDERGWLLVLETDGDFELDVEAARFTFLLPDDEAVKLLDEVKQKIRPWHIEGESVRHDHERYRRTGELPDYAPTDVSTAIRFPPAPRREEGGASTSPSELVDDAVWDVSHEGIVFPSEDELRDRADYERKRDRENR